MGLSKDTQEGDLAQYHVEFHLKPMNIRWIMVQDILRDPLFDNCLMFDYLQHVPSCISDGLFTLTKASSRGCVTWVWHGGKLRMAHALVYTMSSISYEKYPTRYYIEFYLNQLPVNVIRRKIY